MLGLFSTFVFVFVSVFVSVFVFVFVFVCVFDIVFQLVRSCLLSPHHSDQMSLQGSSYYKKTFCVITAYCTKPLSFSFHFLIELTNGYVPLIYICHYITIYV